MKTVRIITSALLVAILISACSKVKPSKTPQEASLNDVVGSFGYEVIETDRSKFYVELEDQDRSFYKPVSFQSARIRSLKTLDAYGGPTLGNYYLSIEVYQTQAGAQKRADEYRNLNRLASVTTHDENELSKMTVRCWGVSSGERVYLLTTHAAMHSALEQKTHSVIDGVRAYEQKAG